MGDIHLFSGRWNHVIIGVMWCLAIYIGVSAYKRITVKPASNYVGAKFSMENPMSKNYNSEPEAHMTQIADSVLYWNDKSRSVRCEVIETPLTPTEYLEITVDQEAITKRNSITTNKGTLTAIQTQKSYRKKHSIQVKPRDICTTVF